MHVSTRFAVTCRLPEFENGDSRLASSSRCRSATPSSNVEYAVDHGLGQRRQLVATAAIKALTTGLFTEAEPELKPIGFCRLSAVPPPRFASIKQLRAEIDV